MIFQVILTSIAKNFICDFGGRGLKTPNPLWVRPCKSVFFYFTIRTICICISFTHNNIKKNRCVSKTLNHPKLNCNFKACCLFTNTHEFTCPESSIGRHNKNKSYLHFVL